MSSIMAPNVSGVNAPGKRTVFSMCGMCSVRCPIEVTVEDGRVVWLQGNTHDLAIGASLCAKGSAGLALEYDDDQRPQTPLIRMGPRGSRPVAAGVLGRGPRLHRRQAAGDHPRIRRARHRIVRSQRPLHRSDADLHTGAGLAELRHPRCRLYRQRSQRGAHALRLQPRAAHPRPGARSTSSSTAAMSSRRWRSRRPKPSWPHWPGGCASPTSIRRATFTACKATRYWQVRPNSDYALNLAIIHELLKLEAYDKDFVARFVSGMDYLAEAVKDTTPEWQEQHTGVPAEQLRAFVKEIAADAPHVVFNPGWGTARHKQSFYVSRTALILNVLMGNLEIPGGFILGQTPRILWP